ncbi:MAG: citrate/2-methylcitrate synthase, partial [Bacillota bacterium]
GFGHRVYKSYDPRAKILKPLAKAITQRDPELSQLYETAEALEEVVVAELGAEKNVFPNVDLYSGLIYKALGIEPAMFTPLFAASRVVGWVARCLEYVQDNRIFRPRAVYIGDVDQPYIPIDKRSQREA